MAKLKAAFWWCVFAVATMLMFALANGCAAVLPAVGAGIDGADGVIKAACPERSAPCEKALTVRNAVASSYNLAVVAEAAGVDATPYIETAKLQMTALLEALRGLVKP